MHRSDQVASNQLKADKQVLDFVSKLAGTFEYASDAAQLRTRLRSLDDNIDKLLNLVSSSSIFILKYVRYSFAGKLCDLFFSSLANASLQVEQ